MDYALKLLPLLLKGTVITLELFAVTMVLSLPLGLIISLLRVSKNKVIRKLTELYTWVFRGTPLLLQIVFVFYGLPFIKIPYLLPNGLTMDRFVAAIFAFVLNYAAYIAEIFRGGIESIDRGQYEAADVLGLTHRQTMVRIVLPQAFKRVLPSLGNEVITLVKDTSLVYVLGIAELLRQASIAATRDFVTSPFVAAGIIYLLLTYACTRMQALVEKKFAYYQ